MKLKGYNLAVIFTWLGLIVVMLSFWTLFILLIRYILKGFIG